MDDAAPIIAPAASENIPRKSRRAPLLVLLLLLIAAVGAWAWWRYFAVHTDVPQQVATLHTRVDEITRTITQLRSSTDTLRARLDDGEKVDASVRQQLLALGDRMRLAEDALANLADHRLSGHDALALDGAESLLTLGGERYRLFHDAPAAIAAYRLADSTLAGVDDTAFSTVRQSIAGEMAALSDLHAADPSALVARLRTLRTQMPQWRDSAPAVSPAAAAEPRSRLARVLETFVQVRRDDEAAAQVQVRDGVIARDLIALDLREAEVAALARDSANYRDALAAARAQIAAAYDVQASAVAAALHEIDALAQAQLAPAAPAVLGAALKELRNLRATHALSTARMPPKPDEVKK